MSDNRNIEAGMIVQHFKRETVDTDTNPCAYLYKILSMDAYHSETNEHLVVYEAMYSDDTIQKGHVCARPYDMFMSEVDHVKYPDIKQKYRFEVVEESRILKVRLHVRYTEDGKVNGVRDVDYQEHPELTPNMPFMKKEGSSYYWCFRIDVNEGRILHWPKGVVADTYYKVCDECEIDYEVNGQVVANNDGYYYCPDFLALEDSGYGDYVILHIDENGLIRNWKPKYVEEWTTRREED